MYPIGVGDRIIFIALISTIAYKLLPSNVFLPFAIVLVTTWIYFQYREKQYWHQVGVPGPNVNIFYGGTLNQIRRGVIEIDTEMFKKYGNSYGSFIFGRREFCTKDPELLRIFFIKEFAHFQNRFDGMPNDEDKKNLMRNAVSVIRDDNWKRIRNRITPAFTTGKLKKLIPILCESTERLVAVIERDYLADKKELPLKDLFGRLVLDEIGRAGFSLNLNTFEEQDNVFIKHTSDIFNFRSRKTLIAVMFAVGFPFVAHCYERLTGHIFLFSSSLKFFEEMMTDIYEKRRADPNAKEKFPDIFQLLMNAVDEGESMANGDGPVPISTSTEDADIIHKELSGASYGKHLTRIELFAQSFILLVAGYETTGATLTFATYMLAMCPDVQDTLRDEIFAVLGNEEAPTYEHLRRMPYLQAVVQETLRMYPIAPKMNRECNSDCVINGIPFCKGDLVTMPIYMIQHDEAFFPEPDKFQPERFMPDPKSARDPLTFLAFGLGPRNCIGMRFTEFQMHVALALTVRRFRFSPGPNTPKLPLKLLSSEMLRPVDPLVVIAEKI